VGGGGGGWVGGGGGGCHPKYFIWILNKRTALEGNDARKPTVVQKVSLYQVSLGGQKIAQNAGFSGL